MQIQLKHSTMQKELDDIGIPYQTLNQGDAQSLRITENSGISFIYTLEKVKTIIIWRHEIYGNVT